METQFSIPTTDGHLVYGTHNHAESKSDRAIILVHGLTGYQYEQHYMRAVPYFTERGFDVIRFDAYCDLPQGRKLVDSSIELQATDLQLVIERFSPDYTALHVAGHSLGAPVILQTDQAKIDRIVLWDPTSGLPSIDDLATKGCRYEPAIDRYIFDSLGREVLLGRAMIDSWIGASDIAQYVGLIQKPTKCIFAEKETNKDAWLPHLDMVTVQHEAATIAGATHGFVEEGTLEQLYEETYSWLQQA